MNIKDCIKDFNQPIKLIYKESIFDLEEYKVKPSRKITIYEDGKVLRKDYNLDGSFKEVKIQKGETETKELFDRVYKIVRNAWGSMMMIDDCSATLKIVYPDNHYEVVDRGTVSEKYGMIADAIAEFAYGEEEDE